jgi:hypothetical protein
MVNASQKRPSRCRPPSKNGDILSVGFTCGIDDWRSREKWVVTATIASWAHKHPYPRSLNLKAVLPQSQTLRIPPESSARVAFAIPRQRATVRPLPSRRSPISPPRLGEGSAPPAQRAGSQCRTVSPAGASHPRAGSHFRCGYCGIPSRELSYVARAT